MKRIDVAILLLVFCLYACKEENKDEKVINLGTITQSEIDNTDVFNIVECIPLDNQEQCLLADVNKVLYFDNEYYVLDNKVRKSVFVFDEKGIFQRKIGVLGHGHGEYPNISDFTIDEEKRNLVILSGPSRIYVYDLEGNFLVSKDLGKSYIWNIISTKDGFIGSTNYLTYTEGDEAFLFFGFDKNFKEDGKWVSVLDKQMYSPTCVSSVLQSQNGKIYYWDSYTNSIFIMNNIVKGIENKIGIRFDNPMPQEYFSTPTDFMENQFRYDFMMEAIVCADKFLIAYVHEARQHIAIINKDGQVEMNGSYTDVFPRLFNGKEGELLYPISAEDYLSNWKGKLMTEPSVSAGNNYLLVRLKIR